MRKLLASFIVGMPLAVSGSTVYTFSEPVANRGTVGFAYTAPDYLTAPETEVSAWSLRCDTSGMPGWICLSATLRQAEANGWPEVQISLNLLDTAATPGDAFSTDQINEGFAGATLTVDGSYQAFLSTATFTVEDPPDTPAAVSDAPEPATGGALALAVGGLLLFRRRQRTT